MTTTQGYERFGFLVQLQGLPGQFGDRADRAQRPVRRRVQQLRGVLVQRDTYFRVPEGRLKLREESPGGAALIQYARDDRPEARESRYRITPVEDPETLRRSLDEALGTLVVVDKERRLLLWEGVRIHLDTVRGLGSFLELEGVAPEDSDLSGEHDRQPLPSAARAMAEKIPGARFEMIRDAGHMVNLEQPQAFNAAVLAFLNRLLP